MTTDIIEELSWRGLIAQSTDLDELRTALESQVTLYAGFDPTAPSLHAGHLVQLLTLRRFQLAGHRPIVLGGGATGLVGDPRDEGERSMNTTSTVAEWADRIGAQLRRFVNFDTEADATPNGAIIANNLDWHGEMTVPTFLRDVGKHFSINVMIARDTVKRRLAGDGISYTEFSYMLLQAWDFVELARRYDCTVQIGGSDQWGNIVSGVDLNRRVDGRHAHALTTPLVTSADGKKFGKSTGGGSLWLDPAMTTPYAWYQYFVNTADADVVKYLRWFTFLSREEIDELAALTEESPHLRAAQRRLAAELTTLVHGAESTKAAEIAAQALFGRAELTELDEVTLAGALAEASGAEVTELTAGDPRTIADLLVTSGLVDSKGAAKRAIREGGAYINNVKVSDEGWEPAESDLLYGRWLVLRRGKKSVAGVKVANP